jgi:AcrR family transcriptional regulator
MTPDQILQSLCERYHLPPARAERLIPLIERALQAPPGVRERILELVESNVERESRRKKPSDRELALDERMLGVVARIIHAWNPPDWLDRWTNKREERSLEERGRDSA